MTICCSIHCCVHTARIMMDLRPRGSHCVTLQEEESTTTLSLSAAPSYIMLLSVCLLLSVFCLSGGLESGIVGGKEVKPHSRPYMASLQYKRQHYCGGMLISDNYVLTSAHCLDQTFNSLEVVLGAHNISQNEASQQIIQVEKYIKHPHYAKNDFTYDIMLLKLKTKAVRNKFVDVVDLPKNNENIPAHIECSIAGWGMEKPGGEASSVLHEVRLKLQFSFECKNKWQQYFNSEKMICSISDGKRAFCQGDSGSPLFCDSKLQGMAAYTYLSNCKSKKFPEVYMKISAFLPWIRKYIK
ncbi:granzyme B(G,H)-like [Pseudorasbora parva]|uniref:granzyme B(G,H)-like n=1 Tax=Pseudorasbora parva TaxID=51549 RepID=UPI00351DB396